MPSSEEDEEKSEDDPAEEEAEDEVSPAFPPLQALKKKTITTDKRIAGIFLQNTLFMVPSPFHCYQNAQPVLRCHRIAFEERTRAACRLISRFP